MASTLRERRPRRHNLERRRMLRERPIEVWENVIDQLQDDKDALLACARVCRGWTARSRHHLRKWLVLRRPEQVARLAKLVRTGSWEVRSCRTVEIRHRSSETSSSRTLGLFALMFAGKMPHLEELHILRGGEWKPGEMHLDVFLHLSAFASVTLLDLLNVTFPSVQTFGRVLSALPALTALSSHRTEFMAHDLRLGAFLRHPRRLATLDLKMDNLPAMHDVNGLLVQTEMASTLKEIRASWPIALRDLHQSGIPALLSSAGASLHSLDLRLSGHTLASGDPSSEIDLNKLVNLQRTRFDIEGFAVDWIPWLCHQLARYPTASTTLRTFTLMFYLEPPINADYAGFNVTTCQQLDDALTISPFMYLEEVLLIFEFINWTVAASKKFTRLIPTRFPKLDARGILRIETINHWGSTTAAGGHR